MISIRFFKTVIGIDFSFLAVLALFLAFDKSGYAVLALFSCAVHETGHLAVMLMKGNIPDEISFHGGGIRIVSREDNSIAALLAGSAANFLTAGIAVTVLIFYGADDSSALQLFAAMNLMIGVFNFIPAGSLDGKKLLSRVLLRFLPVQKAIEIEEGAEILSVFAAVLCALCLAAGGYVNFTILFVYAYVFAADKIAGKRRKR